MWYYLIILIIGNEKAIKVQKRIICFRLERIGVSRISKRSVFLESRKQRDHSIDISMCFSLQCRDG